MLLVSSRPSAWHSDFYCCFEANLLSPPLKFFIDPLLIINSLLMFVLISSVWEYRECCVSQDHTDRCLHPDVDLVSVFEWVCYTVTWANAHAYPYTHFVGMSENMFVKRLLEVINIGTNHILLGRERERVVWLVRKTQKQDFCRLLYLLMRSLSSWKNIFHPNIKRRMWTFVLYAENNAYF